MNNIERKIVPATTTVYPILIVEDSDEDYEIMTWALKKLSITTPVYHCADGDEALDFLYHRGEYADADSSLRPALILLDLNLVATDGREVLQQIKQDDELRMIPVIVWTSSTSREDVEVCFKHGANSYILKPMNLEKLLEAVELLNHYWFGVVLLPDQVDD
jgi:CheY-like chemotaxis protein